MEGIDQERAGQPTAAPPVEILPDKNAPKYTIEQALTLKVMKGLTYAEIGQMFGVSPQAIHERIKPFMDMIKSGGQVKDYDKNRAVLLNSAQLEMLKHALDAETIRKASLGEATTAYERFYKLMRLETDQSTENIAQTVREVVSDESREKLGRIIGGTE